jgi:hypothetical protein
MSMKNGKTIVAWFLQFFFILRKRITYRTSATNVIRFHELFLIFGNLIEMGMPEFCRMKCVRIGFEMINVE